MIFVDFVAIAGVMVVKEKFFCFNPPSSLLSCSEFVDASIFLYPVLMPFPWRCGSNSTLTSNCLGQIRQKRERQEHFLTTLLWFCETKWGFSDLVTFPCISHIRQKSLLTNLWFFNFNFFFAIVIGLFQVFFAFLTRKTWTFSVEYFTSLTEDSEDNQEIQMHFQILLLQLTLFGS